MGDRELRRLEQRAQVTGTNRDRGRVVRRRMALGLTGAAGVTLDALMGDPVAAHAVQVPLDETERARAALDLLEPRMILDWVDRAPLRQVERMDYVAWVSLFYNYESDPEHAKGVRQISLAFLIRCASTSGWPEVYAYGRRAQVGPENSQRLLAAIDRTLRAGTDDRITAIELARWSP